MVALDLYHHPIVYDPMLHSCNFSCAMSVYSEEFPDLRLGNSELQMYVGRYLLSALYFIGERERTR
jgi:hypothetical protein